MQLAHTPRSSQVIVNALKVHYLEWGGSHAPPLLLLHGFSSNAHAWDHLSDSLASEFHIIAPDQRGHGDTDWAKDGYDRERYVSDLIAFTAKIGARRFALMGHSMGGGVAMSYAAQYPETLRRLIIVDIGPEVARTGLARIQTQTRQGPEEFDSPEAAFELMRSMDATPPDHMLRHRAQFALKLLPNGRWTWKYDKVLRTPSDSQERSTMGDLWEALPKITCPTLVVRGETSDLLSRDIAERMINTLPNGSLVEVPKAGHRVPLDNAAEFEKTVREFLAR